MAKLTADTITDEQIRDALGFGYIDADLAVDTGAVLPAGRWYPPPDVKAAARARCAEILNARSEAC